MDKSIKLQALFDDFKKTHESRINEYIDFCNGCSTATSEIVNKYPAFISKGESPVAGIGYGTSELTNDCQSKMEDHWDDYSRCLEDLKNEVNECNVTKFSDLVSKDRGKKQNLFVNRCLITLHHKELLNIAKKEDLKTLSGLLEEYGIIVGSQQNKNDNIEWYNLNKAIFDELVKKYKINSDKEKGVLSCFGWYLKEKLIRILSLKNILEKCHNIILTGAPGTGKTFMAKEIAAKMGANYKFVQFHPSYDYTDFVEGLRPIQNKNNVSFVRTDGVFKSLCREAVESIIQNKDQKYIMIIDEINRGEISKIFGELFFSIDPDYRVEKVKISNGIKGPNDVKDFAIQTQYQNLIDVNGNDCFRFGFFVPENLYIIGTMNDIDRSVDSLDFAMRRRFTFVEFLAGENTGMLEQITDVSIRVLAKKKMDALNKAIINPGIGNLNTAYQVGGSYFVNVNHLSSSDDIWEDLWNYYIKGLVYEYFRGQPNADQIVDSLKNEYDNAK